MSKLTKQLLADGVQMSIIEYRVLENYEMLSCHNTPDQHGQLFLKDDLNAGKHVDGGETLAPGNGIYILYIQRHTLGFLLDVVINILHDIPLNSFLNRSTRTIEEELLKITEAHSRGSFPSFLSKSTSEKITESGDFVRSIATEGPY